MKSEITPFIFGEHHVRILDNAGEPRFLIADVCKALEIANPRNIPNRLHPDDVHTMDIIDSLGRKQTALVCNESGLYALIFQSRKAVARDFTRWVTSEVLPAIRRTGSYGNHHQAFLSLIKDQIALGVSPDLASKNALALSPNRQEITLLNPRVNELLPDTELVVSLMEEEVEYTVEQIAALLPPKHHIVHRKTIASQRSALGKILERARQRGKVTRTGNRHAIYTRVKDIIPFAEGR